VLVTESGVAEGKLVEKDLGFIVLAEGRKSAFFQTSITIPLQRPESQPGESERDLYKAPEQITLPCAEKLAQFRKLVEAAKAGNVQVRDAASEYIQNDFVRERQDDKNVSTDDFILRMTIARLLALSLQESEMTVDVWERAKALDGRRKARAF